MSDAKLEVADFLRGGKPLEQALAHTGGFLASLGGKSQDAGLFAVMMEYQKMLNQEAREDRQVAGPDSRLELASKAGKLELENTKIDQQKDEAGARFDNAMAAAQTELYTGVVSAAAGGASALGQAIGELATFAGQLAEKLATAEGDDDSGGKGAVEMRHTALVSWFRSHDD